MKWCTKLWKALDKIILEMVGVVCDTGFYFKSRKKVLKCVSIRSLAMAFFLVDGENQLLKYFLIAYDASGCVYQPHRRNYLLFMLWILSFSTDIPTGPGRWAVLCMDRWFEKKGLAWLWQHAERGYALRYGVQCKPSAALLCHLQHLSLAFLLSTGR